MTARGFVADGLQAALLLARGRREGLIYVEGGPEGARRSFWAAAICLPFFIGLRLLDWAEAGPPALPARGLTLDLFGFVVGWAGFALLSHAVIGRMGRAERWPGYIAAWNWCNVAQYLLLSVAALPDLLGAPALVQQAVGLVALGWALWLEWYAARLTLGVSGLAAAGLTALDGVVGLIVAVATG